jgi:hypothetical protein
MTDRELIIELMIILGDYIVKEDKKRAILAIGEMVEILKTDERTAQ